MAKVIAEYDTDDNKLKCSVGGRDLDDVMEFSCMKYGDKYSIGILTASMDEANKMKVYTHIVAAVSPEIKVPAQAEASPYSGLLWWAERISAGKSETSETVDSTETESPDFMKSVAKYFE